MKKEKDGLFQSVIKNRKLILNLAKNDFKKRFAGSYLGIIWAFVQPIVTVLVYWFVFEVGLRQGQTSEYPFVLRLMCGLVPWFFFSEALNAGTGTMLEYTYLVKKVVFNIDILPIVKVVSAIFVHLFFVVVITCIHAGYGYYPDLYLLQLLYYIICTFVLVLGMVYISSAVVVFFKDFAQIVGIALQIGVWLTPIMWDASQISATLDMILKINPVYYIVNGFRDALLTKTWFWERPLWTVCFWVITIVIFFLGRVIFKRLRPHFADVL